MARVATVQPVKRRASPPRRTNGTRPRTASRELSTADSTKDSLAPKKASKVIKKTDPVSKDRAGPEAQSQSHIRRPQTAASATTRQGQSGSNGAGVAAKRATGPAVTKPRAPSRLDQPTAASRARAVNAKTLAKSGLETADNSNIASDDDEDELAQPAVTTIRRPIVSSRVPSAARPTAASQQRAKAVAPKAKPLSTSNTQPKRTVSTKPATQARKATAPTTEAPKRKERLASSSIAARRNAPSSTTTKQKTIQKNSGSAGPSSKGPAGKKAGNETSKLSNIAVVRSATASNDTKVTRDEKRTSSQSDIKEARTNSKPTDTQQLVKDDLDDSIYSTKDIDSDGSDNEPEDAGERPPLQEMTRSPAKRIALETLAKSEAHTASDETKEAGSNSLVSSKAKSGLLSPARRVAASSNNRPKLSPLLTLRDFASEDDDTSHISPLKKAPLKHHFGSLNIDLPEPSLHDSMNFLRSPAKKSVARSLFGPVDHHDDEPLVLKPNSPLKRSPKKVHIQKPPEDRTGATPFTSSLAKSKLFQSPAKKFSVNLFSKDILPSSDGASTIDLNEPEVAYPGSYSAPSGQYDVQHGAVDTEESNEINNEDNQLFDIFSDGQNDDAKEPTDIASEPVHNIPDEELMSEGREADHELVEAQIRDLVTKLETEEPVQPNVVKEDISQDHVSDNDDEQNPAAETLNEEDQGNIVDGLNLHDSTHTKTDLKASDTVPSNITTTGPDHEVEEQSDTQSPKASYSENMHDSPVYNQSTAQVALEEESDVSTHEDNNDGEGDLNKQGTPPPASSVAQSPGNTTELISSPKAEAGASEELGDQQDNQIQQSRFGPSPVPDTFRSIHAREPISDEDTDATEDELDSSEADNETVVHLDLQSNKELDMTGLAHQLSDWHKDEVQKTQPTEKVLSQDTMSAPVKRKLHSRRSADPRMISDIRMARDETLTDDEKHRTKVSRLSLPVMKEFTLNRTSTPRSSASSRTSSPSNKPSRLPTLSGSVEKKRYQVTPVRGPFSPKPRSLTPVQNEDKENMQPYQFTSRQLRMSLTPVRRSGEGSPRVVHTVCKVPLRAEDDHVPLSMPRKRSRHLSLTPAKPRSPDSRLSAPSCMRIPLKPCDDNQSLSNTPGSPVKEQSTPKRLRSKSPRRQSVAAAAPPILQGVVVYTDVHTAEGADASGIFVELLEKMGARCVKSWNWNPRASMSGTVVDDVEIESRNSKIGITHVVYKDGGVKTLEKVRQANGLVKCVGVAWVLDCEREGRQLNEDDYAVDVTNVPRGGNKRRKSMEPRRLSNVKGKLVNFDESSTPGKRWDSTAFLGDGGDELPTLSPSPANFRRRKSSRRDSMEWVRMRNATTEEESETVRTPDAHQSTEPYDSESKEENWDTPTQAFNINAAPSPFTPYNPSSFASKVTQQTCPPKQMHARLFEDSPESEANPFKLRLEAARRKSLVWKPKVGSPLAR